ncbi:MAG: ribosome silencing factor [Methylococcales bacterium]|nr:ribosome silencing factor [Methylococcales bacterium]
MQSQQLLELVTHTLDERKGERVTALDVKSKTTITDYMVVATGTSSRHLNALADYVRESVKAQGVQPWGQEGGVSAEWVLLDLGDVIVHLFTEQAREFYQLEKLWSVEREAVDSVEVS